jgi:2-iminobutanoate/2-iminopropanoate deaminase
VVEAGDNAGLEYCLRFLEADPWCFGSGYQKEKLIPAIVRLDLDEPTRQRLAGIVLHVLDDTRPRRETRRYGRLAAAAASRDLRAEISTRLASEHHQIRYNAREIVRMFDLTTAERRPTSGTEVTVTREIIATDGARQNPVYAQAGKAAGLIFVSGQGPFDAAGTIVGKTIQEQTRQCLTNIQIVLEAGGSGLDRLVSVTFILRDPADFAGMNEEWRRWFPADPPARQGAKLPLDVPDMRISIAAIAEA